MRDKNSNSDMFRKALKRVTYKLAYDAYAKLETRQTHIETPMESTTCRIITQDVVLVPVLRAGLGLLDAFSDIMPQARIGYIGLKRNEATYKADEYYYSMPKFNDNTHVILLEIMIATGGSTCASMTRLQLEGAAKLSVVSVIAAPEGIEKIRSEFPDVDIFIASLDRGLDDNKYILPGLGDAGDRVNGT